MRNGKATKPVPQTSVGKVKVAKGRSTLVTLKPMARFATALGSEARAIVKRTTTIKGKARTDYPQLSLVH
jgi:hypothetical protein